MGIKKQDRILILTGNIGMRSLQMLSVREGKGMASSSTRTPEAGLMNSNALRFPHYSHSIVEGGFEEMS